MNKIAFHFLERKILTPKLRRTKQIIELIFKKERTLVTRIDYIFCSDKYLLGLNEKFLNHNYYTDILTFSLNAPDEPVSSEIYISLDRVKENSEKFKVSVQEELLRVIIHGALHLCGFADKTISQKQKMRKLETYYINQYKSVSRET